MTFYVNLTVYSDPAVYQPMGEDKQGPYSRKAFHFYPGRQAK